MEGWTHPGAANNVDFGVLFNAGSDRYTSYVSGEDFGMLVYIKTTFKPGVVLVAGMSGCTTYYTNDCAYFGSPNCSSGCLVAYVGQLGTYNQASILQPESGWGTNCCEFARMTTIAQNNGYYFANGDYFGPVAWTDTQNDNYHDAPWDLLVCKG